LFSISFPSCARACSSPSSFSLSLSLVKLSFAILGGPQMRHLPSSLSLSLALYLSSLITITSDTRAYSLLSPHIRTAHALDTRTRVLDFVSELARLVASSLSFVK
jgi:hypothetical protein